MNEIRINPDDVVFWQSGSLVLNATILMTWIVMGVLVFGSWLVTRRLTSSTTLTNGQNLLEVLVLGIRNQIREVSHQEPGRYLPFVGTLFLFVAVANLFNVIPFVRPPTGSLATTAALATCVFVAVPLYGIASQGAANYLKQYLKPSPLMLPFNIVGELSRTLALAVRLYGNMMSGTVIGAILLGFVPLFIPIVMDLLGLLTGMIQAYIFAILAMVYIASSTRVRAQQNLEEPNSTTKPIDTQTDTTGQTSGGEAQHG